MLEGAIGQEINTLMTHAHWLATLQEALPQNLNNLPTDAQRGLSLLFERGVVSQRFLKG